MKNIFRHYFLLLAIISFYQVIIATGHGAGTLFTILIHSGSGLMAFTFFTPMLLALISCFSEKPWISGSAAIAAPVFCLAAIIYFYTTNTFIPVASLLPFLFWLCFYIGFRFWENSGKTLFKTTSAEFNGVATLCVLFAISCILQKGLALIVIEIRAEQDILRAVYFPAIQFAAVITGYLLLKIKKMAGLYLMTGAAALFPLFQASGIIYVLVSTGFSTDGDSFYPYLAEPLLVLFILCMLTRISHKSRQELPGSNSNVSGQTESL